MSSGLIEAMHAVHAARGYLGPLDLRELAARFDRPLADVYGVATFYHHFRIEPGARHQVQVCTGTACHLAGAPALLSALEQKLQLVSGETVQDLGLDVVHCVGTCGLAPLAIVDGEVLGPVSRDALTGRLRGLLGTQP